jgi:O-methyltransferase involved in polyketide biosynthesis
MPGTGPASASMSAVQEFDPSRPNIARVYDYWLGGKDNFAADRELARKVCEINPMVPAMVRDNRAFAIQAVTRAAESGISQFLDLGAGLPTRPSLDDAARAVNPDARVAYVDFDPVVVSHLRALLARQPGIAAASADLTAPAAVLAHPDVRQTIDLAQPVGIIMACTLHFSTAAKAKQVMAAYMARVVPASQIVVSVVHIASASLRATPRETYTAGTFFRHGPEEMTDWLAGWQMLPPGVAEARRWVSGIGGAPATADSYILCATAVKPQD